MIAPPRSPVNRAAQAPLPHQQRRVPILVGMRRLWRLSFAGVFSIVASLAQVSIVQEPTQARIEIDGKPFATFYYGPDTTKPYLHPLRAASGKILTRRYPMEIVEGESRDHPHHRGLWYAHGDVNGIDFWSSDPTRQGEKFGRIVLERVLETKSGKEQGSILARFRWQDSKGQDLLIETRRMTFYSHPQLRIIDVDITLEAVQKCRFGDTKEGTFAIRVAEPINERRGGTLVNAHGAKGEKAVWGKRAPWADYYGQIDGETYGIAIFDHPDNPKHPPFWHARAYGLFAVNIFGERDFYADPSRDGSVVLEPGQQLRFRYRVVIHPGDPETAKIAELYEQYARGRKASD